MVLNIYKMKPTERMYAYLQSWQLSGQSGCIGCLRGNFGADGMAFDSTWQDSHKVYQSDTFKTDFDALIKALRADGGCAVLKNLESMVNFCREKQGTVLQDGRCKEYGFKLTATQNTYMLRCIPTRGDYNFFLYAYVSDYLNRQIKHAQQGIRFIDPSYKELFRIPDGGSIVITRPDGEKVQRVCRYIDECHLEVDTACFHICEFAEAMERSGNTVARKDDTGKSLVTAKKEHER